MRKNRLNLPPSIAGDRVIGDQIRIHHWNQREILIKIGLINDKVAIEKVEKKIICDLPPIVSAS